jgi:hypothetical protein
MEVVVGKEECVVAVDAFRFANEELEALLRFVADCIVIASDVPIEGRITTH